MKTPARTLNVAEAKRNFSELLARTAYAGDRFVIARRGKPIAALVGVADLRRLEDWPWGSTTGPAGLLGAAKAAGEHPEFQEIMADVYRSRRRSRGRHVKLT
jgi:prevent-host-death family protein